MALEICSLKTVWQKLDVGFSLIFTVQAQETKRKIRKIRIKNASKYFIIRNDIMLIFWNNSFDDDLIANARTHLIDL